MTIGKIIDAILNPIIHLIKVAYLTAAVDTANKSAEVEKQKAQEAREAEMYFQKRSLDLRLELMSLKAQRVTTASKLKAWFDSKLDSHKEIESRASRILKKGVDDVAA